MDIIKRVRRARIFATAASFGLVLFAGLLIFPIPHKTDEADAAAVEPVTTLSIVAAKDTASVEITPNSGSGTFAVSDVENEAAFTVTTNNVTGYSLSMIGNDTSGQLVNVVTGDTLDTISSDIDEATFRTDPNYVNQWGYRLKINDTITTDFLAAPAGSTVKTIYRTTAANASGTADSFTLGIGAKVDYSKPTGTYSNTFTIEAVANRVAYQINYLDNSTGTDLPALPSEGSENITASVFTLDENEPTRTGYAFIGWCYGTVTHVTDGTSTCEGTVYQAGEEFNFPSMTIGVKSTANFYAMWGKYIQEVDDNFCTTTPTLVADARDKNKYVIQKLEDGNCWMMDNLNLGSSDITADLTSANTNIATTVTAAEFNGWRTEIGTRTDVAPEYLPLNTSNTVDGLDTDPVSLTKYGTLYNYCAASMDTVCGESNSSNAEYDICPAGWRLPIGGPSGEFEYLYSLPEYNNIDKMRASIADNGAAFTLSGDFLADVPINQGRKGFWWSSSWYDSTQMYGFAMNPASSPDVYPVPRYVRGDGFAVRCVRKTDPFKDVTYMQDVTPEMVRGVINGTNMALTDIRDGITYDVTKIRGRLWMTQNLRFTGTSLSSATSNVEDIYTDANPLIITYGNLNSGNSTTEARIHVFSDNDYGVLYNYPAATAMQIVTDGTIEATRSICPKGWKLPSKTEFDLLYGLVDEFKPAMAGSYYGGSGRGVGENGNWWASTAADDVYRNFLVYNSTGQFVYRYDRYNGFSVRCIAES